MMTRNMMGFFLLACRFQTQSKIIILRILLLKFEIGRKIRNGRKKKEYKELEDTSIIDLDNNNTRITYQ